MRVCMSHDIVSIVLFCILSQTVLLEKIYKRAPCKMAARLPVVPLLKNNTPGPIKRTALSKEKARSLIARAKITIKIEAMKSAMKLKKDFS